MDPPASSEQYRDRRLGTTVQGRYRVLELLGTGGMGTVYLVEHLLIQRRFALKTLHAQLLSDPAVVARFQREARAATSIGNQHIVEITDMGRFDDDGAPYMVLEYLEGRDLATELTRNGPMPVARLVHIVDQICDALIAVHARGIVHRDLKPDNVFLTQRGSDPDFVKILDFGISKAVDLFEDGFRFTATGTALGTPHFMAPEQVEGLSDVDARADIYAVGGILYNALTCAHPHSAPTLTSLLMKVCSQPAPDVRNARPDLSPTLAAIVARCLMKQREARYQRCEDLRLALAQFRAGLTSDVSGSARDSIGVAATVYSTPPELAAARHAEGVGRGQTGATPVSGTIAEGSVRERKFGISRLLLATLLAGIGFLALRGAGETGVLYWVRQFALGVSSSMAEKVPPALGSEPTGATSGPSFNRASIDVVSIVVSTDPPGAALYMDEVRVENPFHLERSAAVSVLNFAASAPGYASLRRVISAQHSSTLLLRLEPAASASSAITAPSERVGSVLRLPAPRQAARSATRSAEVSPVLGVRAGNQEPWDVPPPQRDVPAGKPEAAVLHSATGTTKLNPSRCPSTRSAGLGTPTNERQ